uniref:Tubulin alpha chain n=1 Tax=Rhodnius prolixus TaxID=13249 RepID=T1HGX2_RHOPR
MDERGFIDKYTDVEEESITSLKDDDVHSENSNLSKKESLIENSSQTKFVDNDELRLNMIDGMQSFFMESSNGSFSPRNLMIDLEPTVVDVIKTGPYRDLYLPNTLISSSEDAANNFARGFYTNGKLQLEEVLETLMNITENCERLQGFLFFHSIGGGTGSGFHSALLEEIHDEFPKISKLEIAIFPSPTLSTAVVEPYNAVLAVHHSIDYTNCTFLADNEAMYDICQRMLRADRPTYSTLNRLLAQAVSSITASLRFKGSLNADFVDFQTNLVPYPRIHFPVMSYAPIINSDMITHECLSVQTITSNCFDYSHRLVRCESEYGRYISCCLLYRGDVTPKDINGAIALIKQKKNVQFVQWSPTGFKIGMNEQPPAVDPKGKMASTTRACCMLCNTTAIKEAWSNLNVKYHGMLKKRAFIHWYLKEGMDMEEFYSAQDDLLLLEQDYNCLD